MKPITDSEILKTIQFYNNDPEGELEILMVENPREELLGMGTQCGSCNNKAFSEELVGFLEPFSIIICKYPDNNNVASIFVAFSDFRSTNGHIIEYLVNRDGGSLRFEDGEPVFTIKNQKYYYFESE